MTTKHRKLIGAAAFAAALTGGAAAGALLGSPAVSGAQEDQTTEAPGTPPEGAPGRPEGGPGGFVRPSLEVAATQLGTTVEELRTALRDGSTVAELAAEKGVDLDALVAAVVDDAVARATEADREVDEARVTELVTRWVNGELRGPGGGGPGGHGGHGPGFGRGPQLETAATALGITAEELRTELEAGKSIADVAGERGVDVQSVIDAMVADATANLTERITDFVNGVRPDGD